MNKKTILWTISIIIFGIATFYGVLYYLQWQDKKEFERIKKEKQADREELTEEEKLLQSITPITEDQQRIFTEEERSIIESVSPSGNIEPKPATDQETQKLLESITPKKQ